MALYMAFCEFFSIFDSHCKTIACALDIEIAFESIWQEGLIYKMKESTISNPM